MCFSFLHVFDIHNKREERKKNMTNWSIIYRSIRNDENAARWATKVINRIMCFLYYYVHRKQFSFLNTDTEWLELKFFFGFHSSNEHWNYQFCNSFLWIEIDISSNFSKHRNGSVLCSQGNKNTFFPIIFPPLKLFF